MTKAAAIKAAMARGYTVHYDTGACGDGGYGSRLYFRRAGAVLNEWGVPLSGGHCTIDRFQGQWSISEF